VARLSPPSWCRRCSSRSGASRDGTRDGAGPGLSIVQSVARAHGASVSVRSQPAGGLNVLVVMLRICPAVSY
jgi:signal transduction histidine kinase